MIRRMPVETERLDTSQAFEGMLLELRLVPDHARDRVHGEELSGDPSLAVIVDALHAIAHLVVLAGASEPSGSGEPQFRNRSSIAARRLRLRRLRMGSPLEVSIVLPAAVLSVPSLSVAWFLLKRAFGADLELRTHRVEKQVELEEALARLENVKALRAELQTEIERAQHKMACWRVESGALLEEPST